jgi:HEAT repeat protein
MNMVDKRTLKRIRRGLASPDAEARAQCADALVAIADVPGLLSALRSPDGYVRIRAAKALTEVPGGRITWRLSRLLNDGDAKVRGTIAQALARRGGWFASRALAHLAADAHPTVRYTALTALAQVDWPRARPLLLTALTQETEGWVRDAAGSLLHRHDAPGRNPLGPAKSSGATPTVDAN